MQSVEGSALFDDLADPNSRLRARLPMLAALSRRFGATLLRRVAARLEADAAAPDAPELARRVAAQAAAADRSLAAMLEPDPPAAAPPPEAAAVGARDA